MHSQQGGCLPGSQACSIPIVIVIADRPGSCLLPTGFSYTLSMV